MNRTLLCSQTREVVVGLDQPFVIIGERINPTGRQVLATELAAGDYSRVQRDALAQVQAGAHVLDINAGVPMGDEATIMAELVALLQTHTDVPLCIDSSVVAALESGLAAYRGKALVNSVTGEEQRLESVLPLVKKHDAAVVAICNDESGISPDPDARFAVAKKILERARDHGIDASDVVVDPLVMPVGAVNDAGRTALRVVARVREELGLNTVCGASNVSFGLPARRQLNATFLAMLMGAGLTSAIVNPLAPETRTSIAAAETLAGIDVKCKRWIKRCRALADTREPEGNAVVER
jgi:5-methyltetrahydrofolate--homocysteine methyltransferase